jgi:DNA-binding winged helix-turn-helix (wHTH) protein
MKSNKTASLGRSLPYQVDRIRVVTSSRVRPALECRSDPSRVLKDFAGLYKLFPARMRKRFGDCFFDSETRQLLRADRPIHLSPKAFGLLELLLQRGPRAISKREIQDVLWPRTFVAESCLTNVVSELRAAVGDRARKPAFLRTVHGFGYAFSGKVTEDGESWREEGFSPFRLARGKRRFALSEGQNIVGRDPDANIHIEHSSVSRRHARISVRGGTAVLEDLQSRNGTFVGGRRIESPVELHDGDIVGLGPVTLTFQALTVPGSTASDLTV